MNRSDTFFSENNHSVSTECLSKLVPFQQLGMANRELILFCKFGACKKKEASSNRRFSKQVKVFFSSLTLSHVEV